jgi:hypothetical protein
MCRHYEGYKSKVKVDREEYKTNWQLTKGKGKFKYPSHMKNLSFQQWLQKILDTPNELKDPTLMSPSDFIIGYALGYALGCPE